MQKVIEIIQKVVNIDLKEFDKNEINPNNISTWDSLAHLSLIMILEEEFNIDIEPNEINEMFNGYISILEILKKYGVENI